MSRKQSERTRAAGASTSRLVVVIVAAAGLATGVGYLLTRDTSSRQAAQEIPTAIPQQPPQTTAQHAPVQPVPLENSTMTVAVPAEPVVTPSPPPAPAPNLREFPRSEPTPLARQLVGALTGFQSSDGKITAEQAAAWKETLAELARQGAAAVPAIREFLEQNLDLNFGTLENGALLGSSTLRAALLTTMLQIGGEEALGVALQTLQTTADPAEIAMLARYLNSSEIAEHRDAVLTATREALALAASGQWDGRDVGPLLDVLKNLGGADAATVLEKYANTWFNYVPLTLADLPDGAGIASLIHLAENTGGAVVLGQDLYQRMLAQAAQQYPDAAQALLRQAQADRINPSAWPGIAAALAGNILQISQSPLSQTSASVPGNLLKGYHIAIGNQNYVEVPAPADMPAALIQARIQLLDNLLGATSNPAAITALREARATLSAKLNPQS